jgi:magnesium chelatase family protein
MNPCRCGWYGHPVRECTCNAASRKAYVSKISGPLLDRIDIQTEVPSLEYTEVSNLRPSESSAEIRKRITKAREFASFRFGNPSMANGLMTPSQIRKYCVLDEGGNELMKKAYTTQSLTARSYDRILKVARTVADFDFSEDIKKRHVALALQLRTLDKKYFN